MGDYGDLNAKLKIAVDELDDISEHSSHVDLRALESKQEINLQASKFSLLRHKSKEKLSVTKVRGE